MWLGKANTPALATCAISAIALLAASRVGRTRPLAGAASAPRALAAAAPVPAPRLKAASGLVAVLFSEGTTDVPARREGIVAQVLAAPGERVRRGAIVAQIDAPGTRFGADEARSAVAIAEAERRRAELERSEAEVRLQRTQAVGAAFVSRAEVESVRAQAAIARSRVELAAATVRQQQARLAAAVQAQDDATVLAPFDGTVALRYAARGAYVHVGAPVLRLVPDAGLWVRFAIPEGEAPRVAIEQRLWVEVPDAERLLDATVMRIAPEVHAASRMVFAEARVDVPSEAAPLAIPGREVRVRTDDPRGVAVSAGIEDRRGGGVPERAP